MSLKYLDAKGRCQADNSYLATPRSYTQNLFLIRFFPTKNIWIGINDINSEGRFISVDGYPVTYTRWAPGNPNNWGNEDGVHIVGSDDNWNSNTSNHGRWNDNSINESFRFVCFRRI